MMSVISIAPERAADAVSVLCDAFYDYPVMRFVLGDRPDYDRDLRTLVIFFVMARVYKNEYVLGIDTQGELAAAALVSRPGVSVKSEPLNELREQTWDQLGASARTRYEAFGEACLPFDIPEPHLHLNMIGVQRKLGGQGYGKTLLEYIHGMSASDSESTGVSLTTETENNVRLYQHMGYKIIGENQFGADLTTYGFFRPD